MQIIFNTLGQGNVTDRHQVEGLFLLLPVGQVMNEMGDWQENAANELLNQGSHHIDTDHNQSLVLWVAETGPFHHVQNLVHSHGLEVPSQYHPDISLVGFEEFKPGLSRVVRLGKFGRGGIERLPAAVNDGHLARTRRMDRDEANHR